MVDDAAVVERGDDVVDGGRPGRSLDLLVGGVRPGQTQVVGDRDARGGARLPVGFFVKQVWLFVPIFTGIVVLPATLSWLTSHTTDRAPSRAAVRSAGECPASPGTVNVTRTGGAPWLI